MKYFKVLFLIILCSCSMPTKEEQAKAAIKEYLKMNLNDFSSYEPVLFGKLDSVYTTFEDSEEYERLVNSLGYRINLDFVYNTDATVGETEEESYQRFVKEDSISKLVNLAKKEFKPSLKGYSMKHRFRSKGEDGNIKLFNYEFYLDSTMNGIEWKRIKNLVEIAQ